MEIPDLSGFGILEFADLWQVCPLWWTPGPAVCCQTLWMAAKLTSRCSETQRNDDSPNVNTNQRYGFNHGFIKWCRISSRVRTQGGHPLHIGRHHHHHHHQQQQQQQQEVVVIIASIVIIVTQQLHDSHQRTCWRCCHCHPPVPLQELLLHLQLSSLLPPPLLLSVLII